LTEFTPTGKSRTFFGGLIFGGYIDEANTISFLGTYFSFVGSLYRWGGSSQRHRYGNGGDDIAQYKRSHIAQHGNKHRHQYSDGHAIPNPCHQHPHPDCNGNACTNDVAYIYHNTIAHGYTITDSDNVPNGRSSASNHPPQ